MAPRKHKASSRRSRGLALGAGLALALAAGAARAQTAAAGNAATPSAGTGAPDPLRTLVAVQSAELDVLRDTVAQMKADLAKLAATCAAGSPVGGPAAPAGGFVTHDEFEAYKGLKGCILHRYLQSGPPSCPQGYQPVAALRGLVAGFGDDGTSFTSGPADRTLCCK